MARNCSGSEARGYCLYLGKRLRMRSQSLLMLTQGYGEITIPKYPYLEPLISDYHRGPDQLGMALYYLLCPNRTHPVHQVHTGNSLVVQSWRASCETFLPQLRSFRTLFPNSVGLSFRVRSLERPTATKLTPRSKSTAYNRCSFAAPHDTKEDDHMVRVFAVSQDFQCFAQFPRQVPGRSGTLGRRYI